MRRTLYVDLQKALYGLKQSGLLWNDLLVTKLTKKHGMEKCMADPCIFRKIEKGVIVLILAVHVDDMALARLKIEVDSCLWHSTKTSRLTWGYYLSSRGVRLSSTLRTG